VKVWWYKSSAKEQKSPQSDTGKMGSKLFIFLMKQIGYHAFLPEKLPSLILRWEAKAKMGRL
jgi:hypothetical protein